VIGSSAESASALQNERSGGRPVWRAAASLFHVKLRFAVAAGFTAALTLLLPQGSAAQADAPPVVLTHVTVIDMIGTASRADVAIVVNAGRITAVEMVDSVDRAVAESLASYGDPAVAIIPEGPYVIPVYQRT